MYLALRLLPVSCAIVKGSYTYSYRSENTSVMCVICSKVTKLVNGRAGVKCRFNSISEAQAVAQCVC